MELIGLSGFARSGKDEAANVLVNEFGFKRVAFADKLREVLYQLNPIIEVEHYVFDDRFLEREPVMTRYVQDVIDTFGWDGYKETAYGPEIRRLLQRLGTEAGRQTLWDTIWIDAALDPIDDDRRVVVTDARFFNEFEAIRDRGGEIWRIDRAGVGPANNHPSETEAVRYGHFAKRLYNSGSLEEYHSAVRHAAQHYLGEGPSVRNIYESRG